MANRMLLPHRGLLGLIALSLLPFAALLPAPAMAGAQGAAPGATPPTNNCPMPVDFTESGVTVGLAAIFPPDELVSFGLPLPPGAVQDAGTLGVSASGAPVPVTATVLLEDQARTGAPADVRAVLVQLPADVLTDGCAEITVAWQGEGVTLASEPTPYAEVSAPSAAVVDQATYTITEQAGEAALVISGREARQLFAAREPTVLATFPAGYLAATGLLGPQVAATDLGPDLAGLAFISEAVTPFGLSAMYQEPYPINAANVIDPTDPEAGYEGWLYDRCATFLAFAVHTGDTRFLREAYRLCAYYADHIELTGENRGIFTGKPDPDPKYSHLRGLTAYYALTGDETAREAATAIAERFLADQDLVAPYRAGHVRALDHLWTERQLAVSLEALVYGYRLTGDTAYLTAAGEIVATAHRHLTGDAAALATINPGAPAFPPQNCFIHTAAQAAEGNEDEPWCSGWMPALLVDPLLAYQATTDDPLVDEIFIRLTRYLRDVGSAYFDAGYGNADDTFLDPAKPSAAPDAEDQRVLVPLYGAALDTNGARVNDGEYDDYQHCLDVTAITAAGLRALQRTGGYDQNPIGPFASEGESFLALHEEFAACAAWTLAGQARPHRDPATWSAEDLAQGLADPAAFIADNNIGNVSHNVAPQRKISWWFNPALAQFTLLTEAGIAVPELRSGIIQPGATGLAAASTVAPAAEPTTAPAVAPTAIRAETPSPAPTAPPEPSPTVRQPAPPASGPGSDDTRFPAAAGAHHGAEPGGYWLWEPLTGPEASAPVAAGPFPVVLYLSGCCGNGDWPTPEEVDPWLSHLARQGYVVIAPVYRYGTPVEDTKTRLKEALAELATPGHAGIDLSRFAVIGFSYGGMTAVQYAASAWDEGLPVPAALFLAAPCTENGFCLDPPAQPAALPPGLKALVLAFADDTVVDGSQPRRVYRELRSLPSMDRDFITMPGDRHGTPPIVAGHDTTYATVDAADWYGGWKLADALFACVFTGQWCDYALGDTPEQRFMGTWSDGVPVAELEVADDAAMDAE